MTFRGRIGPYSIVEWLGSGAMGEVYRATDTKMFGRDVALKVLSERLSGDERARARFRREVEVASRLSHPNVVSIHDRGETAGRPFFVMEFLDGPSLAEWIRAPTVDTLQRRLEIAEQICDALAFAHRHGIVHRDVKPGNVVLVGEKGSEVAKLLDFGIVHVERSTLTRPATQPGTYSYMSPEQLRNERVTPRSDLFSFGIVLYEMLTGVHPFEAASEPLVAGRILSEEPAPPGALFEGLPAAVETVVLRLLEKEPENRPASAREVAAVLAGIRRRLDPASLAGESGEPDGLDDLQRDLVENLRRWGRKRESEGRWKDALGAYERALAVAPDSEHLARKVACLRHRIEAGREIERLVRDVRGALDRGNVVQARDDWRKAWIVGPDHPEVRDLERRLLEAETGVGGGTQSRYAAERLEQAERALAAGRAGEARDVLADLLARDPGDPLARFLMARSRDVEASGVDYVAYRRHLAEADRALAGGDYDAARGACDRAGDVWNDDDEWKATRRRVEAHADSAAVEAIARAERALRAAESSDGDPEEALRRIPEIVEGAERAGRLGAPEEWIRPLREEARRLETDLRHRLAARERERRSRAERRARIHEEALSHARALVRRAEEVVADPAARDDDALYLYEAAREEVVRAVHEAPEHPPTVDLAERIDARIEGLRARVEEHRARTVEARRTLRAVRAALESARRAVDGDLRRLDGGLRRLRDVEAGLARLARLAPDDPDAAEAREEAAHLLVTIRRRRDREHRRATDLEAAFAAGRRDLEEAGRVASAGVEQAERAERLCASAVRHFSRVLILDESHRGALDCRAEALSLQEHVSSERRRGGTPDPARRDAGTEEIRRGAAVDESTAAPTRGTVSRS